MSKYKLIAFDMDGTLLDPNKELTKEVIEAIDEAARQGKIVCFSTGRCLPELEKFFPQLPSLRYVVCCSGAVVYDCREDKMVHEQALSAEQILELLDTIGDRDIKPQILAKKNYMDQVFYDNLSRYHMEQYRAQYTENATLLPDVIADYREHPYPVYKINFYHTSVEERAITRAKIGHLPYEMVDSEITSIEISCPGVSKAVGIRKLCEQFDIRMDEVIAVGDADNDLVMLGAVGLPIAMGNANEHVKAIAKAEVADNAHNGAAEAIYKYLLADE